MNKNIVFQVITILALTSCTTVPTWVDTGSLKQYQDKKYVTSVGCDKTDDRAEKQALEGLSRRLEVSVQSHTNEDSVSINQFKKTVHTKNLDTETGTVLFDTKIVKTWHSNNQTCVFVVLNKQKSFLDTKIDINKIKEELNKVNYPKNTLKALRMALFERQLSQKLKTEEETESVLNRGSFLMNNFDTTKEDEKAIRIIKKSTFYVQSTNPELKEYTLQKLKMEGFRISDKPKFIINIDDSYKKFSFSYYDNYVHLYYRADIKFLGQHTLYKEEERTNENLIDTSFPFVQKDMELDIEKGLIDGFVKNLLD